MEKEEIKNNVNAEKLKVLNSTLEKLEKTFGKGSIMRMGETHIEEMDVISTGSIGLDTALGVGGFPKGRIVEIYGPESSGKTTLAIHAIAEAQKQGGIAAFIDAFRTSSGKDDALLVRIVEKLDKKLLLNLGMNQIRSISEKIREYEILPPVVPEGENRQGEVFMEYYVDEASLWETVRSLFCEDQPA